VILSAGLPLYEQKTRGACNPGLQPELQLLWSTRAKPIVFKSASHRWEQSEFDQDHDSERREEVGSPY